MLLHGIFPPITTPFYPDGNIYFKKLEANVAQYSKTPAAGIVVLGSTGEAILLSDQERREVLKTAREASAPHKVLIAGTGVESASETLKLTEYAATLGYDVAMAKINGAKATIEPFLTGLLDTQKNEFYGRPAYVFQMKDGSLLVSDENNGATYRISYETPQKRAAQ